MNDTFRRGTDFQHSAAPGLVLILLTLLSVAFFWPGTSFIPPTDRDESRYIEASRQMASSNDWVDIHFQVETRYRKPIGIYWAEAGMAKLFGESAFNPASIYRWPSVIGAGLAVLATYYLAFSMGGALAGLLASFILASTLLLNVEARLATPDALLLAAITFAYAALYRISLCVKDGVRAPPTPVLIFWAAIGVGILLKGPVIVLMLGLSILTLKAVERDKPWLSATRPLYGIWLALLIAAPWFIAIYLRSGYAFFQDALGHDFAGKLTHGQENHFAPPGSYLLLLPITFWPGSLLAMGSIPFLWKNRRVAQRHFLAAWIVPNWIALELIPTKLPHYILPLFPALAALVAITFAANYRTGPRLRVLILILYAVATAILALGLGFSADRLGIDIDYGALHIIWFAIAAGVFAVAIAAGVYIASRHDDQRLVIVATLSTLIVYGIAFGLVIPSLSAPFLSRTLAQHRAELPGGLATGVVTLVGYHEPSAVVLLGANTILSKSDAAAQELRDGPAVLAIVAEKDDADFKQAADDLGLKVKLLDRVEGYDYVRGKKLLLNFYCRAPE